MYGIDVSENNGQLDWSAIERYNATTDKPIEFAIVRSSYGRTGVDSRFAENVEGAHSVGLKVGAYHYGYALDNCQAITEAQNCRGIIDNSGVLLELPVFYDMEDADGFKRKRGFNFGLSTGICKSFLDNIGLDCGIYASYSWLTDIIDWRSLGCAVWNAQWNTEDDLKGYMWQYTDSLAIPGFGNVDGDVLYN